MSDERGNPFERYGLDPREGARAITERLRELAEDATDDTARTELRATWEELTMHPARRLRAALGAHPETRPALGAPPPRPARAAAIDGGDLAWRELVVLPSVRAGLTPRAAAPKPRDPWGDDRILASPAPSAETPASKETRTDVR